MFITVTVFFACGIFPCIGKVTAYKCVCDIKFKVLTDLMNTFCIFAK